MTTNKSKKMSKERPKERHKERPKDRKSKTNKTHPNLIHTRKRKRHKKHVSKSLSDIYTYESDVSSSTNNNHNMKQNNTKIVHGLKDFLQGKNK